LKEARYNKSKAARILNIDRKTLYLKMEKYGIE
jgi:two-component system response regulator HydG